MRTGSHRFNALGKLRSAARFCWLSSRCSFRAAVVWVRCAQVWGRDLKTPTLGIVILTLEFAKSLRNLRETSPVTGREKTNVLQQRPEL